MLNRFKELYEAWDERSGRSGDDSYEDADEASQKHKLVPVRFNDWLCEEFMSYKADIDEAFRTLIKKNPNAEGNILVCRFEIFEALEWDMAAEDAVKDIKNSRHAHLIDGNMECYLNT